MTFLAWFVALTSLGLASLGALFIVGQVVAELGRTRARRRPPVVLDASPLLRRGLR